METARSIQEINHKLSNEPPWYIEPEQLKDLYFKYDKFKDYATTDKSNCAGLISWLLGNPDVFIRLGILNTVMFRKVETRELSDVLVFHRGPMLQHVVWAQLFNGKLLHRPSRGALAEFHSEAEMMRRYTTGLLGAQYYFAKFVG